MCELLRSWIGVATIQNLVSSSNTVYVLQQSVIIRLNLMGLRSFDLRESWNRI